MLTLGVTIDQVTVIIHQTLMTRTTHISGNLPSRHDCHTSRVQNRSWYMASDALRLRRILGRYISWSSFASPRVRWLTTNHLIPPQRGHRARTSRALWRSSNMLPPRFYNPRIATANSGGHNHCGSTCYFLSGSVLPLGGYSAAIYP